MFSLCKFTGYLWNSFEYIGEDATETIEEQALVKELGKSDTVFPSLITDLRGNGYHLYVDNSSTSERLNLAILLKMGQSLEVLQWVIG